MTYDYGECQTCARKGDPYCVGCQPMMMSDGKYSRTLYTPHNGTITFTSQIGGERRDNEAEHRG